MTSLKKNFIYNMTYQVLLIILPLITAPYVSRVLGVDGVGTFSYIYFIAYYFGLCGMLGVSNHGNRSVAQVREDRKKLSETFCNVYSIQFVTTMLALVLYIFFVLLFFKGNKTVALIDTLVVVSYVLDINWFFFGMEKFKLTVTRNTIIKISIAVCTFAFVKDADDLWKYTLILTFGMAFSQLYLWFYIKKYVDFIRPSWKVIKQHIKPMLILFIPVIAYSIYKIMDKIMIGALTSVTQVGLYENADKIISVPISIITAFGTVMMPRISSLAAKNESNQIETYSRQSFQYFTIIVVGMVCGIIGVSDVLAPVYFGVEFTASAPLIAGLSVTLLFVAWANIIRTQYLIPNKKNKPYVVSTVVGAIVNLVFNITFIPVLQAFGALIGTVLAEFMVFIVQLFYVRKEYPVFRFLKPTLVYFPMGIIMLLVVRYIGTTYKASVSTLLCQIVIGAALYMFLVIGYFAIKKEPLFITLLKKVKPSKGE